MTKLDITPSDFIPLSNLAFHVLLALADGAAHGYAIGKDVEQRSAGALNPTTGGLYHALRRLEADGLVEHASGADEKSPDTRRRHFQITKLGRKVAALEARRLNELVSAARSKQLFTDGT